MTDPDSPQITWQHATRDDTHPVEPRYSATGRWVCYVCRELVNDGGRAIDMTWKGLDGFDIFAAPRTTDADQPGLQVEGS